MTTINAVGNGLSGVTGSGAFVGENTPTLITPNLGIPASGTLTNCTGLPIGGITGLGTGVATALAAAVTGSGGIVLDTSPTLTTPNLGTPSAINLANATNLALAALPTGTQFNTQQGTFTTSTSTSSATFVDTGITVNITPLSASDTVLVRATVQFTNDTTATGMFQLVRGSTPIGIGTSVGSRDAVGSSQYNSNGTVSMSTCTMEWLDSPATTSATTYKVQYAKEGGTGNIYINRSGTDTNSAGFPRTASVITVCEVKV